MQLAALVAALAWSAGLRRCSLDCGANGVCADGACFCHAPYTGPRCEHKAEVTSTVWYATLQQDPPAPASRPPAPAASAATHPAHAAPPSLRTPPQPSIAASTAAQQFEHSDRAANRAELFPAKRVGSVPVQSVPLQLARSRNDLGDVDVIEVTEDVNTITRFALNAFVIIIIIVVFVGVYVLFTSNKELSSRVMFLASGDTKLRWNSADMVPFIRVLPSEVVRIERIIIHDVQQSMIESVDVFVEVDFGTNMPATTRVRNVQGVSAMLEPNSPWGTLPKLDQPKKNRVVFTDRMEFNMRPYRQAPMTIRVKDQDMIGNELLGMVEIDAEVIREKARENASKRQLSYSAALSFQLRDPNSKTPSDCKSRILIWFTSGGSSYDS